MGWRAATIWPPPLADMAKLNDFIVRQMGLAVPDPCPFDDTPAARAGEEYVTVFVPVEREAERLLGHHADSLGGSPARGRRHRSRYRARASATQSCSVTSAAKAASLMAWWRRAGMRAASWACVELFGTRMGGSFRAGRRHVGGDQEALCRALVGGRNGAETWESFLRPEPGRGLV